ncbi:MAG: TetR/AcrR family transcriptional regulator [Emergencia timonensis]|uniref:TetR/AcrR family transcriptional regulator n=1 Tax=Emergencia timonensis TaxID=1776384 RepID=UPI00083470E4|nr:TetR/AcrR family transcriptional regulator [Emergencia timonensis]WNX90521.1 TetR/AcrR family transcriptional regulator [Emergencia timonensis]
MFILEVVSINKVVTSEEAILQTCRQMVSEEGIQAINMRAVARRCDVALGSLYNYFSSKEELVTSTIESVWRDIFHTEGKCRTDMPFPDYVNWIYKSVKKGTEQYPNFFTAHSISFASNGISRAKRMMEQYFSHMRAGLLQVLEDDKNVRRDAFSDTFTRSDFADFVQRSLLSALAEQKDCSVLTEMIRRSIY